MSATASRSAEDAACSAFLSVEVMVLLDAAAAPINCRMDGSCTFCWFFCLATDAARERFTMPIIPVPPLPLALSLIADPGEDRSVISMPFAELLPRLPPNALPYEQEAKKKKRKR